MQSESSAVVFSILRNLFSHAPMLLVALGGLILAFVNWSKWPRASLLLALGCGLQVALGVGMPILYGVLPRLAPHVPQMGTVYTILSFGWSIASAVSFGLIILAVYAGRKLELPAA